MLSVFSNIISIFSITLVGYLAAKLNWLPLESSKFLSKLLINITSPCLILYSMSHQELTSSTGIIVKQVMILTFLAFTIASLLSVPAAKIMKASKEERGTYRVLLSITNNGFMGYPLALAVFGEKGLFLMISSNAVMCLFLYSGGVFLMTYDKHERFNITSLVKSIVSIPVLSILTGLIIFATGFQFPVPVDRFLDTLGGMTVPLSMLVIGIQLQGSSAREVARNHKMFITVLIRLIVSPVLFFLLLWQAPIDPLVLCIVVYTMSMPSAAAIVVLSELYGTDTRLAAEGVFLTTTCSLVTIPVVSILLTAFLGSRL